jgi:hypothetical protein
MLNFDLAKEKVYMLASKQVWYVQRVWSMQTIILKYFTLAINHINIMYIYKSPRYKTYIVFNLQN